MDTKDDIVNHYLRSATAFEYGDDINKDLFALLDSHRTAAVSELVSSCPSVNAEADSSPELYLKALPKYSALEEYNQTKNKIIESNLRLVISIAKKYFYSNLDTLDIIQYGNLGLIKSIDNFMPKMGYKFTTYATWWIKQAISRGIGDTNSNIRIPIHVRNILSAIFKFDLKTYNRTGMSPTTAEIAKHMNMSVDRVDEILEGAIDTLSIDMPIGDDLTIGDILAGDDTPHDKAIQNDNKTIIDSSIECLTPREQSVINKRYGLSGEDEMTLSEIGVTLGVTRERIRQIESQALAKLKKELGLTLADFML